MCVIFEPIASSTGRTRSTSAASPPHMIVRVPFSAPSEPPETGASTSAIRFSASRAPKPFVACAEIVDMSTTTVPALAVVATPSAPKSTWLDIGCVGHDRDDDVGIDRRFGRCFGTRGAGFGERALPSRACGCAL